MSYYLKEVHSRVPMYYVGMIGGMITHISEDLAEALKFSSEEKAIAEREKYPVHLSKFEVVQS